MATEVLVRRGLRIGAASGQTGLHQYWCKLARPLQPAIGAANVAGAILLFSAYARCVIPIFVLTPSGDWCGHLFHVFQPLIILVEQLPHQFSVSDATAIGFCQPAIRHLRGSLQDVFQVGDFGERCSQRVELEQQAQSQQIGAPRVEVDNPKRRLRQTHCGSH
jgi:hypothetical protein